MAEIVSIHIARKSKIPTESCDRVEVRANFGIEGDSRSGKYQIGQITLIESEVLDMVSGKLGYEIPAGASRRQIVVKGITLNELIGKRLRLGIVLVQVVDRCKPCNNMEVMIGPGAKEAMNGRGGMHCRIIEGGVLHIGDKITVENSGCPYCARLSSLRFKFIIYIKRLLIP